MDRRQMHRSLRLLPLTSLLLCGNACAQVAPGTNPQVGRIIDEANLMARSGFPAAEIDAWVKHQLEAIQGALALTLRLTAMDGISLKTAPLQFFTQSFNAALGVVKNESFRDVFDQQIVQLLELFLLTAAFDDVLLNVVGSIAGFDGNCYG